MLQGMLTPVAAIRWFFSQVNEAGEAVVKVKVRRGRGFEIAPAGYQKGKNEGRHENPFTQSFPGFG